MIRAGEVAVLDVAYTWSATAGRGGAHGLLPTVVLAEQK
jgi:hypothetical protein